VAERACRLRIHVITLFPEIVRVGVSCSILGRAREAGIIEVEPVDLRSFGEGPHLVVDDYPYGGGPGMVMKPGPVCRAVRAVYNEDSRIILLTPQGRRFDQQWAEEMSRESHLVLVCGRYEGFDERIREVLDAEELSVGDYVLTGGEVAALVVIEAVCRLVPGVVGDPRAPREDSFARGLLEAPRYTRPADFEGHGVPEVLLSGHHERVRRWRLRRSLLRTLQRRPDLLAGAHWDAEMRREMRMVLEELRPEPKRGDGAGAR